MNADKTAWEIDAATQLIVMAIQLFRRNGQDAQADALDATMRQQDTATYQRVLDRATAPPAQA